MPLATTLVTHCVVQQVGLAVCLGSVSPSVSLSESPVEESATIVTEGQPLLDISPMDVKCLNSSSSSGTTCYCVNLPDVKYCMCSG